MNFNERFFAKQKIRKRRIDITLSEKELDEVRSIAAQRNNKEQKFGAMTYGAKRGSEEAHLIGLAAEQAVARYAGSSIDKRIFEDHGDEGLDLENKWGVKCTTYFNDPYLRVEIEHFKEEIAGYVLCCVIATDIKEVSIVGWASKDAVRNGTKKQFLSNGPINYVLEEQDLQDMKNFKL